MLSYTNCELCPRRCHVDRTRGELGFCREPDHIYAARAAAHYWEEPVISGNFGSGAVFFSGCTLKCIFCQNRIISQQNLGKEITTDHLREIFLKLIDDGVQNINLVTPTHFLPSILPALTPKLPIPIVYNCGGYERVETLRELEGLAAKLSRAPDYVETAKAAIQEMYRQVGSAVIEDDIMQRGLIVRHLILPGELDNTLGVLDWFAETFPKGDVLFSLMSQYVPMGKAKELPPYDRKLTEEEYDAAISYLDFLGIESGFTQDFTSATEDYIPDFSFEGLE